MKMQHEGTGIRAGRVSGPYIEELRRKRGAEVVAPYEKEGDLIWQ